MRNRRWLIILLLLVLTAVVAATIYNKREAEGEKVFTEQVTRRTIQETVAASGKVFPQTEVKISSVVSGEVVELLVEEGDSVRAGQPLAKIDPELIQSQVQRGKAGVSSARAQLANARAQVEAAKAQVAQIEAQLENAREIHQRNEVLYQEGVVSEADYQASLSNLRALQANLSLAQANQRSAEESAKAAEYNVESSVATLKELQTSLQRTTLYAPVHGIVSMLNVEEGESVVGTIQMAGTELMRIANLGAMEVRVEVSENDIPRVAVGNRVEIEVDAYVDRKFRGTVYQVASSSTTAALAENNLTSDQVTNFEVRINIDPSSYQDLVRPGNPYPFRPGMSASVEIFTRRAEDVLSLPIQAVTTREKEDEDQRRNREGEVIVDDLIEVVFVVEGDSVQMVEVVTGLQDDTFIELKSGVQADQQVVVGPYTAVSRKLKQGMTVNVVSEEEYYETDKD
ncbi:MAG: HlyD family efflux transporter periplasmic adaptor subunit [Bacteroidetes bacterium]|nr:MAG: HlyD family efflux transporter periplasmic adaptor subunit [Bacteroidota bacterium]